MIFIGKYGANTSDMNNLIIDSTKIEQIKRIIDIAEERIIIASIKATDMYPKDWIKYMRRYLVSVKIEASLPDKYPKKAPIINRYNVLNNENELIKSIFDMIKSALLWPSITCCLKVLKENSLHTKITNNIPINKLNQLAIYVMLFHTLGKL